MFTLSVMLSTFCSMDDMLSSASRIWLVRLLDVCWICDSRSFLVSVMVDVRLVVVCWIWLSSPFLVSVIWLVRLSAVNVI